MEPLKHILCSLAFQTVLVRSLFCTTYETVAFLVGSAAFHSWYYPALYPACKVLCKLQYNRWFPSKARPPSTTTRPTMKGPQKIQ